MRVRIDDTLLHENVEVFQPSAWWERDEVPLGPLVLRGDLGPVAFGNIRVLPVVEEDTGDGWIPLFDGESLHGWQANEDGLWTVEDGILIGEGPRSHLFHERDDLRDFEVRARLKISDGGNSGLYFRTAHADEGWPRGYEAQINSSYADLQKTGSLYGLAPVTTHLIAPDTWFDYHVTCRDGDEGTRIVIRVNGAVIVDYVDTERRFEKGRIALQQHHDGSVLEVKLVEVREL